MLMSARDDSPHTHTYILSTDLTRSYNRPAS
ncbi:hypothetical protein PMIN01_06137 [Paraphaeosphaeria minitans]|uniref:Uncharacterized protein n=1 Tax=Paraphaeosphaeria minitans TaxID=565426 RepID=A0A9P6KRH5_9PLEO|nr:hypothetical protein PMIN01_06137 [Paraphaeosphaeria minitans]